MSVLTLSALAGPVVGRRAHKPEHDEDRDTGLVQQHQQQHVSLDNVCSCKSYCQRLRLQS